MGLDIQLADFTRECFDLSQAWITDPDISSLIRTPEASSEERLAWFNELSYRRDYKIWSVKYNETFIGACGLKDISENSAEYWGYIGEKTLWGKGIGYQILQEVFRKAREMGSLHIWLLVDSHNTRAIRLYGKAGFREEGVFNSLIRMSINL